MFKRKQDVDKHVSHILSRKRDEKERNAVGFQIARLYVDIKEYAVAKRYLSGFMQVRENVPQAHQLLGEVNEALGQKETAVENFKRSLDLAGYGSSNKHLILKICELYCELGTDVQRMKYWLEKCEKFFPKSEIVFKMKAQLAEASTSTVADKKEMESLVVSELVNRPTDLNLRMKLLNIYLDSDRLNEAYDTAVSTDLTMAFVDRLPWFECLMSVFLLYGEKNPECLEDASYNQHYLHVLRNLVYLSLPNKEVSEVSQVLHTFDQRLKHSLGLTNQDEAWVTFLREMKGQMFFLAGLLLLKRAPTGSISWQEVNQLSGACFLASRSVDPMDAQAPWFVKASKEYSKFYNWWHLQSYDRLSQVGHMLQQLSTQDVLEWSKGIRQQTMTAAGHQRVFKAVYNPHDLKAQGDVSFFYQAREMVDASDTKEPLTIRHMIDVDRVAYQVHMSDLSHLVWLCLQRYTADMNAQPNYHFSLMENIHFSVKTMDSTENLCQLDLLVFLLASVRCAASAVLDNMLLYEDRSMRPTLMPVCLSKPMCTQDQAEWWSAAFKFCNNSVKDDFSHLRRVLIRGIETVRLVGHHGVSLPMMAHIARSLDAKAKSLKTAEYGCRCSVFELNALEGRAAYYWEKTKQGIQKLQRNQHSPLPKYRLFKEGKDMDIPTRVLDKLMAEATFALAVAAMKNGQHKEALEGFEAHKSPWAKYYSAEIYKNLVEQEENGDSSSSDRRRALLLKARDNFHTVLDLLNGDKSHELNMLVMRELDDLESKFHSLDWEDERDVSANSSFHTPNKSPQDARAMSSSNGVVHSTPRNLAQSFSYSTNGVAGAETGGNYSVREQVSSTSENSFRPRPSPERLDSQIKSINHSQASLLKMVLERNEELILSNGKMMMELRDNRLEIKSLMEELKNFHTDMMKHIKSELSTLKHEVGSLKLTASQQTTVMASGAPPGPAPPGPAPPLFMPHMAAQAPPRGPPFPGYPPQGPVVPPGYGGYMINSTVPPQPGVGPQYRPTGLPGSRPSTVGKYRLQSEEEEEDDEEDQSNIDEASAFYREYVEQDPSFSQYFTPDSQMMQDWSFGSRPGIEPQPPMPMPALQPRMAMPAPGYFASALRGRSLQYAQSTPGQVKAAPGPGFFSSPDPGGVPGSVSGTLTPVTMGIPAGGMPGVAATVAAAAEPGQSPALMAALTDQRGTVGGPAKIEPPVTAAIGQATQYPSVTGLQVLFQAIAAMEPRKLQGTITILVETVTNRATVLMMGETREILFHHDISGLQLEPSAIPNRVTWTAIKVGSADRQQVTVTIEPATMATQFRDAIHKAIVLLQAKSPLQPGVGAAAPPRPFAGFTSTATSTFVTSVTSTASGSPATQSANKLMFGGLSFTSTPNITPNVGDKERVKVDVNKTQTAAAIAKSDVPKPFAGFSLTTSTPVTKSDSIFASFGQAGASKTGSDKSQSVFAPQKSSGTVTKSPGGAVPRSPGGGEDEHVEEYEPNVDFKPVITLPELVEKKTGEENEVEMFVDRCRLFRFDQESKQWKERGVGELKILKSKESVKFRVIMRRDQILKLCANHALNAEMKLTNMASSDRAWCYSAMDYSEEEMKAEQLAVKFKNADKAQLFQQVFNDCVQQLKQEADKSKDTTVAAADSTSSKPVSPAGSKMTTASATTTTAAQPSKSASSGTKSLNEMFKPKAGSWECGACLVRNNEDVTKCPACGTVKPGAKPIATSTPSFGGAASSGTKSLSQMFKPKAGSWECDGCLVRNNEDIIKCPACGTLKPGAKPEDVGKDNSPAVAGSGSGFSFGAKLAETPGTGFKFGAPAATTAPTTGGFSFTGPAATTSTSSGGFRFGSAPTITTTVSTTSSVQGSGFTFKPAPATTSSTATTTSAFGGGFASPAGSSTTPAVGFTFKTPAASTTKTTTTSTPASGTSSLTFSFGAGPKPTGFSFATPSKDSSGQTTTPATSKAATAATSSGSGLLVKLLTSDESEDALVPAVSSKPTSSGFSFSMQSKSSTPFGAPVTSSSASSSQGFNFSFNKSPAKPGQSGSAPIVPGSPEVDEHGLYVNKEGDDSHIHFEPVVALPDKVEVKTGEEDEQVLFEGRGKMYRFVSGEWKEKGVGSVKILEHKVTKKTRVLMRRDQVLKICCNHKIEPSLSLQPMAKSDGKAWVWFALDFSEDEGKMEQLALRFRTADIAGEFKRVFDQCRDQAKVTPTKDESVGNVQEASGTSVKKELFQADSTTGGDEDDDVIFVYEEKPTMEQVSMARKYQLPDNFYLYETRPPCPGCIGCQDGELPAVVASPRKLKESPKAQVSEVPVFGSASTLPVFGAGANLPDLANLTSDDSVVDSSTGSGFMFGNKASVDFHSLATSGKTEEYSWKKSEGSSPFKFAGAGKQLFGGANTSGAGDGGEDGDESVAPSEDIHFEPVIPLPDLVEVKTGEEDWTPLFCCRAKLYKFDNNLSQWKERGIGEIKIMSHNAQTMFRVLQRREQVLKVACNHLISTDMELKPMSTSETSWCWIANDFTDVEPSIEQFAVKFKTKEIATDFKQTFERCQAKLREVLASTGEPVPQQYQETGAPNGGHQTQAEEEEEEEDEEDEGILFEKKATLSYYEDGAWKKIGVGTLKIVSDEDLSGSKVQFIDGNNTRRCSHVITRELQVQLDRKHRTCEWQPIDYSTDEPIRRQFSAVFSSVPAAEEFAKTFTEGVKMAMDSELSEKVPREMVVPEIFSGGEPQQ